VPLSPTDTADALKSRSLADPGLRALFERAVPGSERQWPRKVWDLEALTLAALYYEPNLRVARAQWRVAEAGSGQAGREIEGPMAIVILGGLVTSTALNLLVLPTLALRWGSFERPVADASSN
jgi:hypothetical protein